MLNSKNISKKDPGPVGSGLFWVTRIRINIFKTGSADPDPKKMDRIRNTNKKFVKSLHYYIQLKLNYLLVEAPVSPFLLIRRDTPTRGKPEEIQRKLKLN